ncbi:hypothetical protein EYM_00050 [Ignicoccus islandicus DSM 13165]|uniref:Uncharacterized protein n=1 Tax=Ignicoccus islandicus DSM 13165 TaxID=940295 RepID=A0A0U3F8X7_9CREN|nr:hypothetical protein [Ignicoccus islandicus]ALU12089.1 hypothetical protein EYM_00050 [Ignicoccus islandicus DSM 13165]
MIASDVLTCKANPSSLIEKLGRLLETEIEFLEDETTKIIQSNNGKEQLLEFRCTAKVIEIYLSTKLGLGVWKEVLGEEITSTFECIGEGYVSIARSHVSPLLVVTISGNKGWFEGYVSPKGRKVKGTCPFPILTELAIRTGIKLDI